MCSWWFVNAFPDLSFFAVDQTILLEVHKETEQQERNCYYTYNYPLAF